MFFAHVAVVILALQALHFSLDSLTSDSPMFLYLGVWTTVNHFKVSANTLWGERL